MPSLVPLLCRIEARYYELGDSVVVDGDTLLSLVSNHDFFNGSTKCGFFDAEPREIKPEAIPITSDIPLHQVPPEIMVRWMHANSCIAGLGDGNGLNFATDESALAQLWG